MYAAIITTQQREKNKNRSAVRRYLCRLIASTAVWGHENEECKLNVENLQILGRQRIIDACELDVGV